MAIKLDPKEVETHLYRLGYCNVTGFQLKEFIKDLKKLMKYDENFLCTCKHFTEVSESSYIDTSPETITTYNSISTPGGTNSNHTKSKKRNNFPDSAVQNYASCGKTPTPNTLSDDKYRRSNVPPCSAVLSDTSVRTKKCTHFSKCKDTQRTKSLENLPGPVKPKSSFIRPWNIQQRQQGGVHKCSDPVKLYHHYQDIWRRQKVPGEGSHSDLRWSIREKMLGEDPHPCPNSQASSKGILNNRLRKV